jgi:hypothetical protein
LKRPEIDRRLAAGEPAAQVARDYDLNPSSLHRHRTNCLKLAPASAIKREAARGSAAVALLPSKETLSGAYFDLRDRIDQIATQAQEEGSLKIALSGLSAVRQTLDSLARLASQDRAAGTDGGPAGRHAQPEIDTAIIAARLLQEFDQEPDIKARIAKALVGLDDAVTSAASATVTVDGAGAAAAALATHNSTPPAAVDAACTAPAAVATHDPAPPAASSGDPIVLPAEPPPPGHMPAPPIPPVAEPADAVPGPASPAAALPIQASAANGGGHG